MLLNEDTVLSLPGSPVVLVPYKKMHVERYHQWMQDTALLEATASERLSLKEEHENMTSWQQDPKKLTFIILDSTQEHDMAGDVNLHLLNAENEGFDDPKISTVAELEVMVAEPKSRRKGMASAALRLIMSFARLHLGVDMFVAKILDDNLPSLKLFQDVLGFHEYKRVPAFKEVHLSLAVTPSVEGNLEAIREEWNVSNFNGGLYCLQANTYAPSEKAKETST